MSARTTMHRKRPALNESLRLNCRYTNVRRVGEARARRMLGVHHDVRDQVVAQQTTSDNVGNLDVCFVSGPRRTWACVGQLAKQTCIVAGRIDVVENRWIFDFNRETSLRRIFFAHDIAQSSR